MSFDNLNWMPFFLKKKEREAKVILFGTMLNLVSNQAKSNEHILLGLFLAIFNTFSSSEPKIITLTFWSCMKNILRLGLNHGCILHFRNIALVLVGPCLKSKIWCENGSRKGLASNYKSPRAQRWQLPSWLPNQMISLILMISIIYPNDWEI